MRHFFCVVFTLFFINNALFSETSNNFFSSNGKKSFAPKPGPLSETPEDDVVDVNEQHDDLSKEDIAELELAFECSPKRAQVIVNHLQDPHYFPHNRDYRSAYFVGVSGSGKTSTARAIGYKMSKAGWDYKFIGSTELLGEYRNQTALQLKKELQKIVDSKRPTVVVIDELHRLLENTESKHHDTDTAATALWLFLDKQRNNENFFLIGTMNRIAKLPKPFKDRILTDVVTFPKIDDAKVKNSIFRRIIMSHGIKFDNAVTDQFLDTELAKLEHCTGRKLHKIAKLMFQLQRIDSKEQILSNLVKREDITKSIALYIELQKDIDYDYLEETDEERQNRYHIENMNLQKQQHQENQRLQEQHFIQEQCIKLVSSSSTIDAMVYLQKTIFSSERMGACLSNKQIDIINKIFQEAKTRREQK